MGEGLIQPEPEPEPELWFTDIFESQQAWYLSVGMTVDEFWNGPPELAKVYRDAMLLRERRENVRAWRNGLYMVHALDATVMNVFRKKSATAAEYLSEPLPLTKKDVEERQERDAALAEQRIRDRLRQRAASRTVTKK